MEKQLRFMAAAASVLLAVSICATAASAGLSGDVNGDGSLNRQDAAALQNALLGKTSAAGEMDINQDRVIDARDMTLLKRAILYPQQPVSEIKDYGTPPDTSADMYSNFRVGDVGDFFASDGWTNESPFDCWWYKRNAVIDNGYLSLSIDQKWNAGDSKPNWNPQYSGGEFRTNDFYHYGYYETSMQAMKNDGVVSSFFTYTGPSDDNPWDEIDIEILGKDTTKVQLNYYKNGQGGHEQMIDLGFDASEGFHTYGFDWQPDHITWYVDGKAIHTMYGDMPSTPGKIMMNAWPGRTVDNWLKPFNGNIPLTARYQWVTYKKSGNGQQQTDPPSGKIQDLGTPPDTSADMYSNFRTGDAGDFFASDGWTNESPFDCWWYKRNAVIGDGYLSLSIDQKWNAGDSKPNWNPQYSGGEFRTNKFYSYGYYETSMQAMKNDGVVSSFFTYTGPSDDNPWDEIDIEILGKDTTKVQLNYYKNGQGGHEQMIDLGFDSSLAFHTYGFDWQPDHITWYVDGKAIHTMYGDMPSTPGKIMMNAWPGRTVDNWLKPFNGNIPLTARYQWVTYKASAGGQQQGGDNPGQGSQGGDNPGGTTPSGLTDYGTKMNANATMVSNFSVGDAGDFFASDGWTNESPFDCWWYKQNAFIKDGCLQLSINQKWNAGDSKPNWNPQYSGGEFRTNQFYHYGYYETSMQAIKNDGVVSSFFTYTGPSDDNPWDEIDIEILGKDTTQVQLNYYKNGQGGHEKMISLGFDASQGYHTYGFDWQRDHITWYVDGKEVYTMYGDMPSTPGKIMMNAWPGRTVDDWLKPFNGNIPLTARYQWVTYNKQ